MVSYPALVHRRFGITEVAALVRETLLADGDARLLVWVGGGGADKGRGRTSASSRAMTFSSSMFGSISTTKD